MEVVDVTPADEVLAMIRRDLPSLSSRLSFVALVSNWHEKPWQHGSPLKLASSVLQPAFSPKQVAVELVGVVVLVRLVVVVVCLVAVVVRLVVVVVRLEVIVALQVGVTILYSWTVLVGWYVVCVICREGTVSSLYSHRIEVALTYSLSLGLGLEVGTAGFLDGVIWILSKFRWNSLATACVYWS